MQYSEVKDKNTLKKKTQKEIKAEPPAPQISLQNSDKKTEKKKKTCC